MNLGQDNNQKGFSSGNTGSGIQQPYQYGIGNTVNSGFNTGVYGGSQGYSQSNPMYQNQYGNVQGGNIYGNQFGNQYPNQMYGNQGYGNQGYGNQGYGNQFGNQQQIPNNKPQEKIKLNYGTIKNKDDVRILILGGICRGTRNISKERRSK